MAAIQQSIWRHMRNCIIMSLLVALVTALAVWQIVPLRVGAELLSDVQMAMLPRQEEQHPDIVVVAVTEKTYEILQYRSPINRQFLANILLNIEQKGVRAVGLDILHDQPTVPDEDAALRRVLENYSRPIVVAVGNAESKLTARQLEFQAQYLAETATGLINLVKEDGKVRYTSIWQSGVNGERLSFAAALAQEIGVTLPAGSEHFVVRETNSDKQFFRVYPAERVTLLPSAWFEDKIVLIGAILPHQDGHQTPLSVMGGEDRLLSGVMVHAHMLAQFIDGIRLPILSKETEWILLAVFAALGFMIVTRQGGLAGQIMLAVLVLAALWVGAFAVQVYGGPLLPLFSTTMSFGLSLFISWMYSSREERVARRFLRNVFTHYLSPNVIEDLVENPAHLELGGERCDMSFVFADLANYTALSESVEPETLVELVQSYQDGLVEIALGYEATIERFVGDATMIFFGAPVPQPDHAERALHCARDWDRFSQKFREKQRAKGIELGVTRIGVHSGPAVVGNIGGKRRFAYTAHGDTVNVAARLETANKQFGTRVCVSKDTSDRCPDVQVRPVGNVVLKGRSEPVEVLTISEDLSPHAQSEYVEAFNALVQNRTDAREQIDALARKYPDDRLLAFHQARLMQGGSGTEVRLENK